LTSRSTNADVDAASPSPESLFRYRQHHAVLRAGKHGLEVDVSTFAAKKARSVRDVDADRLFDIPVVKIVLPKEIHNEAIWDLDQMNVNATSLFPGLDGFARSLNTWFRDVV
jgi:hypothetical protein